MLDGAFYATFKGRLVLDDIISEVESINAHLSSRDYSSVSGLSQWSPHSEELVNERHHVAMYNGGFFPGGPPFRGASQ